MQTFSKDAALKLKRELHIIFHKGYFISFERNKNFPFGVGAQGL